MDSGKNFVGIQNGGGNVKLPTLSKNNGAGMTLERHGPLLGRNRTCACQCFSSFFAVARACRRLKSH